MKLDIGTMDVPTAGNRVQLSSDAGIAARDRIRWAMFRPREGNTGEVYIGVSDVSATHGLELDPGGSNRAKDQIILPFKEMGLTVAAEDIWFDADTNGNDVDWVLVIED